MLKTEWKPQAEIEYFFVNAHQIAILGCDGCAEQCGTGGTAGVNRLKLLLNKWGKEVVLAEVIEECCDEALMKEALSDFQEAISSSDALVILSCASGVKAAYLCTPESPVVAVLDTIGGAVFTRQDNIITRSLCKVCGHCVLTYTAGICPVSTCPSKSKYAPCRKSPEASSHCIIKPEQACVWKEIARKADLDALRNLRQRHAAD